MNKYTPGPWRTTLRAAPVEEGNDDELEIAISGSNLNQRTIAATFKTDGFTVYGYEVDGCSLEEAQANARLIAAAPEMLDELRECRDLLMCVNTCSRNNLANLAAERLNAIVAIIAKATGSTA